MSSIGWFKNCWKVFLLVLAMGAFGAGALAQPSNLIRQAVDPLRTQRLAQHHPLWASDDNSLGAAPAEQAVDHLTLTLTRTAAQEQALQALLAEQQNPASANYHRWLTAAEFGERFGASDADLAAIASWLTASGLHVNWISPSRNFIDFGGTAGAINQTFQTELRRYKVNGEERLSVSSAPAVPAALAPAIQSIRGLFTVKERPASFRALKQTKAAPQMTNGGDHYIAPADFNTIYNVPNTYTGSGYTIGIVGRSRVYTADLDNFRARTEVSFANPTVIVPTAYGGVDPGAPLTAPPTDGADIGDQSEATLDVERAGSTAPGASLLLVAATDASGGIVAGMQYLIQTSPAPAQIINISFAACEASASASVISSFDTLFQQAAAEGISVFVSSGDAGASDCETAFEAPPASPSANSVNLLCSSSYVTCVGGTEFADDYDPSGVYDPEYYWNTANASGLSSAKSYMPEGAWNESTTSLVAASGGGVSTVIATPAWQAGLGVPTARAGRYTPDVSFSAAAHDGYFGCFAAGGGDCVSDGSGAYGFSLFYGTSASAPSMAGVAALLNQKSGASQGNLNPGLYQLAASDRLTGRTPAAFHDVTLSSSGVSSDDCNANTPSMCNNTIPSSASLSGGQAGYLIGAGYDEATGLGSLDVQEFLDNYALENSSGQALTPTVKVTPNPSAIAQSALLQVVVEVSGRTGDATPTGSITLSSGSYLHSSVGLSSGNVTISVPASVLSVGTNTLTALYTPDAASAALYTLAQGSNTVTVLPPFTVTGSNVSISAGAAAGNCSTITVTPATGFTGDVKLTAQITAMPANAQDIPTLSFNGGDTVTISGSAAATTSLTITTTCLYAGASPEKSFPWRMMGGGVLACLVGFGLSGCRRRWRRLYWGVILLAAAAATTACSQISAKRIYEQTTPGVYTITVTGVSGAYTATTDIYLTVR